MEIAPVDRFVVSEERALGLKFGHSVISLSDGVNTNAFGCRSKPPPALVSPMKHRVGFGN